MPDIFGRRPLAFGGAFAADAAAINFATNDPRFQSGVGLVTQNIQISYQQPITRIYEVGTVLTYYIAGRPQGQMGVNRILGPGRVTAAFYAVFGNVCNAAGNYLVFDVGTGCDANNPTAVQMYFLIENILMQSIGLSVAAQDMIINEALSFMFTSMQAFDDDNDLAIAVGTLLTT